MAKTIARIKVRDHPDIIQTLLYAIQSGNYVRSVEVSPIYKGDPSHKTGWAWLTVTFSEVVPSGLPVEIYTRRRRGASRDRKRPTDGYVYLLAAQDGATYKIGKTANPKSRRRTFGVKLPFAVEYVHVIQTDDMGRLERALHKHFAAKRLRGSEFFRLSSADVEWIKSLGDSYPADACAKW